MLCDIINLKSVRGINIDYYIGYVLSYCSDCVMHFYGINDISFVDYKNFYKITNETNIIVII